MVAATLSLAPAGAQAGSKAKKLKSPLKNFEITPPEYCLGTHTKKENDKDTGWMLFISDLGEMNRIDYRRSPAAAQVGAASDSVSRYAVYEKILAAVVKEGELLSQATMNLSGTEALFAVASFPGGAATETITMKDGKQVRERADSIRGVLIFSMRDFHYVLQHEVGIDFAKLWPMCSFPPSGPNLAPEQRDQTAREGLQQLYASIAFK